MIRHALIIAGKDLRSELRTKESLNSALSLTIVLLLLFSFAFDPASDDVKQWAGGLLWMVYSFAAILIITRGFARELSNDCLEALRASPVPASALFLGKAMASFLILLGVELISLPVFGIFYQVNAASNPVALITALVLATWGVTVIGTVFGAVTVNLHLRELMLPVLIYPMMIPALMAAIELTSASVNQVEPEMIWYRLLIGFNIIFTALSLALVDIVLVD